jgi:hypothetical protein
LKNKVESVKQSVPANARAGSMKQPGEMKSQQLANNAYNEQAAPVALQQNLNIQNQPSAKGNKSGVNADCVSSSKVSEKLDKKHLINLSTGNQKNIKVSIGF